MPVVEEEGGGEKNAPVENTIPTGKVDTTDAATSDSNADVISKSMTEALAEVAPKDEFDPNAPLMDQEELDFRLHKEKLLGVKNIGGIENAVRFWWRGFVCLVMLAIVCLFSPLVDFGQASGLASGSCI